MAEKKIQPKRPATDEPAAGSRKAQKTSAKAIKPKKFSMKAIKPKVI
ncbi:MAG TPA: hypothetical protein VGQ50_14650 [Actinomycetota bacterium]|jgi:hypothetical protein|nr:hypothetical protein [Actinomycetota bacterium]